MCLNCKQSRNLDAKALIRLYSQCVRVGSSAQAEVGHVTNTICSLCPVHNSHGVAVVPHWESKVFLHCFVVSYSSFCVMLFCYPQ